jgi:hypothetical protein
MKLQRQRIVLWIAVGGLLLTAASIDGPTAPAGESLPMEPVAAPWECAAWGCMQPGDPARRPPLFAMDVGTLFSRVPH